MMPEANDKQAGTLLYFYSLQTLWPPSWAIATEENWPAVVHVRGADTGPHWNDMKMCSQLLVEAKLHPFTRQLHSLLFIRVVTIKNVLAQNHQNWKTYHKIISRSRLRKGRLLTALELKNGTEIIVKVRSHARAIFTAILGKIFLTISMARKVRTCEQPAI